MFWIMIPSTATADPTGKLEEITITCNIAHERELWRRRGGHDEHLRANSHTCIATFLSRSPNIVAISAIVAIVSYSY